MRIVPRGSLAVGKVVDGDRLKSIVQGNVVQAPSDYHDSHLAVPLPMRLRHAV